MKKMIAFLEEHVSGKTVKTKELTYTLESGKLEGVYSDQMSFCNLRQGFQNFQLDLFVVSNEKIYQVDENGNRGDLTKDFSGVSLFRFEFARRSSSGQITGAFRFLSASGRNIPAEAVVSGLYDVSFDGNVFRFREDQMLYRDQPNKEGSFKAVAFQAEQKLYLKDGMLHYEYHGQTFDVDTNTLKRSASSDHYPPFISIEA